MHRHEAPPPLPPCAAATLIAAGSFAASALAGPSSVVFNGNAYYLVSGNNPKMDTGEEVCASMGKLFDGHHSINTNDVCKLFHPTAKTLVSVNGKCK